MKHGGSPSNDWPNCMQYFRVAAIGAGAAAPVAPAGLVAALTATPDFPKRANALSTVAAEIPTRTGVGLYAMQYDPSFIVAKVLNAPIDIYGAAGMWAAITSVVAATRTITFATFNAGGAATDLPAGTSMVVVSCECQDSNT